MKIYKIKSETNPEKKYSVRYFEESNKFVCDCPSYAFGKKDFECKHILYVKRYLKEKSKNT